MAGRLIPRLFLVDPRELWLMGIAECLEGSCLIIIGQAVDPETALPELGTFGPDLVLVGPNVPEAEAFHFCRQIKRQWPNMTVILNHVDADDALVQTDAVDAGAAACLAANIRCQGQLAALATIIAGREPVTRQLAYQADQPADLTPREYETLVHMARNETSTAMAGAIGLATATVRNYAQRVREKLQVNTSEAAVRRARRRGMI